MCGLQQDDHADAVIAGLAATQHGVVSRSQLLAAGVSPRQIEWRLKRRRLHTVHRGVYATGHAVLSHEGRWMAAILVAGEPAQLSFWSGANLWRMRSGGGPRTHVTCPRARRNRAGIAFHQCNLPPDEVTIEQGIPVTTPARTLLDLAPLLPSPTLARMLDTASNRGAPLAELLDRYPRKPGGAKLRALLGNAMPMTRSDFEAEVIERIGALGLPRPEVNAVVKGYECDLVWRAEGVIGELDSYATHGSRLAFEQDRERDRKLALAGWRVVRITDERCEQGLADLSRLLAASAARSRAAA